MSKSIPTSAKKIAEKFVEHGYTCYIAGGWCRDYFFESKSSDIDLFCDAPPGEIPKILKVVGEIGKKYGTYIIAEDGKHYEITSFRKDIGSVNHRKPAKVEFTTDLFEDAQRRDFTCNAIYYDILGEKFIDPVGGIQDIETKTLRFVGKPKDRLEEDILRLLRYVRYKYKYNLQDAETEYQSIFLENSHKLSYLSRERLKQELEKIFLLDGNYLALQELKNMGVIQSLFPALEILSKTPGGAPWHLEGDVWKHTLMCVEQLHSLGLNDSEKIHLVWTMLWHDSGKSDCLSFDENGRVHYYGHEEVSAKHFSRFAIEWNFSKKIHKKIYWLIENHLRVGMSLKMSPIKRHRFMMHPYFPELLKVYEADKKGRIPVILEDVERTKKYFQKFQNSLQNTAFFSAKDVLEKHPDIAAKNIGSTLENWNNSLLEDIQIDI